MLISAAAAATIARIVALMARETRRGVYRGWVTGFAACSAMIDAALIAKRGMLASKFGIRPIGGVMTTGTIQTECA